MEASWTYVRDAFLVARTVRSVGATIPGIQGLICNATQTGLRSSHSELMKPILQKHRRLFAMGILLTFMASWGLPAQAYFAALGSVPIQASCCPNCQMPCCDQDQGCIGMAATCAASMLPMITTPAQSLDKVKRVPVVALDYFVKPVPTPIAAAPVERSPDFSRPTTVIIRFCTFQE